MKSGGIDADVSTTRRWAARSTPSFARELGPGTYRTRKLDHDVTSTAHRLTQNAPAMEAVLDTIRKVEGVWRVYRKEQLSGADPLTRQAFLTHYEGRSGDVKILPRAYWVTSSSTTTHGTGHRYDTHVPVMLFGFGIKKGEYLELASPIDLAPTLAFLTGVTLPDAMGRVLTEALIHH